MRGRPLAPEELLARAAELSRQRPLEQPARRAEEGLLVLLLAGETYGIAASAVQEVVCRPVVTPLPANPQFVSGVMNLRGEVVAVLDLAEMFGLKAGGSRPYAVVARHEDLVAAIRADEVLDVEWFTADTLQPVVATVSEAVSCFFTGVFHLRNRLVTRLDLGKILAHPELLKLRKPKEAPAA